MNNGNARKYIDRRLWTVFSKTVLASFGKQIAEESRHTKENGDWKFCGRNSF